MTAETLPVEMVKGANIALRDLDEESGSVTVVLETAARDAAVLDADVSVLLLGADGRVRTNADMVFYNQRVALAGAIRLREKVRGEVDGTEVVLDTITINLDDVPDDVERIVVLASLDPALETPFGAAAILRMRVQRASDGQDLISYAVHDAADEMALLFGEFYRRAGLWRIRAIGQGYRSGLAQLATDFGVDIEPSTEVSDGEDATASHGEDVTTRRADDAEEPVAAETSAPAAATAPARLAVSRPVRAPKMPAAWNRTIPADDGDDWKPARLFPVAGIGGAEEQEQRATSVLLAVASMVKEFGRALVAAMGGRPGTIETFTEVRFGQDDKTVRPDGVVLTTWGQRSWTALIEVKTAGKLESAQIDSYVDVARSKGYDAVVMITNELTTSADDYPVDIDRRKLKKVALLHLGWDEIRNIATLCLDHRGVTDATQRKVLAEFLRYMDHPRSGLQGFTDLGQHWPRVRESARSQTLRAGDRGSVEVINRFDQLVRHIGLGMSGMLGVDVQTSQPGGADTLSRCQQFADSGVLFGTVRVPGAVDAMVVRMDVRSERVSCAATVPAPRDGRPATRVNWLLRQLDDAPDSLRVEAMLAGARGLSTAEHLRALRSDPQSILPTDSREMRAFRLTLEIPMSAKRESGRSSAVGTVEAVVYRFYAEVLQNIQRWSASRPPKVPA